MLLSLSKLNFEMASADTLEHPVQRVLPRSQCYSLKSLPLLGAERHLCCSAIVEIDPSGAAQSRISPEPIAQLSGALPRANTAGDK